MVARESLPGGVANAGKVSRVGGVVMRPSNPATAGVHALLRFVRDAGFEGVPEPLGVEAGRERLRFIPGDVPISPYPTWSLTDAALASMASLLRRFHDATVGFDWRKYEWSGEVADPTANAAVMCHNDVCFENVVFRDGAAVALLDFDFVAPGRAVFDLAQFARMCVPLEDPIDCERLKGAPLDPYRRLRIVASAYGLDESPAVFVQSIEDSMRVGEAFFKRHVADGEPAFVEMWSRSDGQARFDRRWRWFERERSSISATLAADVLGDAKRLI